MAQPPKSAGTDFMNRTQRHGSSLHADDDKMAQVVRFAPQDITETVVDGSALKS